MEEVLRWASLAVPIIALFGVWVKFGELKQTVHELTSQMTLVSGKQELLRDDVARHKVEVARDYATNVEVRDALQTLTRSIEKLGDRLDDAINGRKA